MPTTPTDTYIYLKGGRGDGFVPLWTGAIADAEVNEKNADSGDDCSNDADNQ